MEKDAKITITRIKQTGKYKILREYNFIKREENKISLCSEEVLYDNFFGVLNEMRMYESLPKMEGLSDDEENQIKNTLEKRAYSFDVV